MSNESEHSGSEFYHPSQQSDVEQLQFPTYSKSWEWKSTLLTNWLRLDQTQACK